MLRRRRYRRTVGGENLPPATFLLLQTLTSSILLLAINKRNHTLRYGFFFGGDGEDRTLDLLNAIQALSQLSYAPIFEVISKSEE